MSFTGVVRGLLDLVAYRRAGGDARLRDLWIVGDDRRSTTPVDAHYFQMEAWAMRHLQKERPPKHLEIAGRADFSAHLASTGIPTTYLNFRKLPIVVPGLEAAEGDIMALPYPDASWPSVSCLHVAEHIGLGRYGDPVDPRGLEKGLREIQRILAPGGTLLLAMPSGRARTVFNAHRVVDPDEPRRLLDELTLEETSAVLDDGSFSDHVDPATLRTQEYACGLWRFRKGSSPRR